MGNNKMYWSKNDAVDDIHKLAREDWGWKRRRNRVKGASMVLAGELFILPMQSTRAPRKLQRMVVEGPLGAPEALDRR